MMSYLRYLSGSSMDHEAIANFLKHYRWQLVGGITVGFFIYKILTKPRNLPPGPCGLPFVGTLFSVSTSDDAGLSLRKRYGDVSSLYFGQELQVWLTSHAAIREAFQKHGEEFSNKKIPVFMQMMNFQDEIFTAQYSDKWKKDKKFFLSALRGFGFGSSSLEGKIQAEKDGLISHLQKIKVDSSDGSIDLKEPMAKACANLICNILYSQRYDPTDPELDRILSMVDAMFNYKFFYLILLNAFPRWLSKLLMPSLCKELPGRVDKIRQFLIMKIKNHKKQHQPGQSKDFLDVYLDDRGTENINYEVAADNCLAFFPDSIGSLSDTIIWALLCIVKYPHVQKRIHADIDQTIGRGRSPLLTDKQHLAYLEAVILESLRLGSLGPLISPRIVLKDIEFRGFIIPKDTCIMASIYAAHYDQEVFPDPHIFRPERFLNAEGQVVREDQIIPFGLGTRSCIGKKLVKMETFLFLANLLQKYHFSFSNSSPEPTLDAVPHGVSRKPPHFKVVLAERSTSENIQST